MYYLFNCLTRHIINCVPDPKSAKNHGYSSQLPLQELSLPSQLQLIKIDQLPLLPSISNPVVQIYQFEELIC